MNKQSHLEQVISDPEFKPFDGPEAELIVKRVKDFTGSLATDEEVQKAVGSLSRLSFNEFERMSRYQDKFCNSCGKCCRECHPVDFMKEELRAVAKRLGTSYKKLKKKLNARPRGEYNVIAVPGKPCPFLEGRNECTIYDLRPHSCRLYPLGKPMACILGGRPVETIKPSECFAMQRILEIIAVSRIVEEWMIKK